MSDTNLNDASFTPTIPDSEENTNQQTYSATGSFRFWCQKVLPLVYDDSLSYYELLCKVVTYLNNVIQNVDNLNTSVTNTNTAFDNLQDYVNTTKDTLVEVYSKLEQYVNDYFNNLDVQEEINAKLDAMASDGSLSGLISPLIPSLVAEWLSENITPTSPAIDASLSVSGAGADAKVTGDRLSEINDDLENNTISLEWTQGKYVSDTDGTEVDYAGWSCTDYIEIPGNTLNVYVTIEYGSRYNAFYDENKTFIASFIYSNNVQSINVPSNAKYFRLSCDTRYTSNVKLDNHLVQRVDNLVQRVDNLDSELNDRLDDEISEVKEDLKNNTISLEWTPGKYISDTDGTEVDYASWSCTDYISVNSEIVRIFLSDDIIAVGYGSRYNAFYDSDHAFVSSFMFNQQYSDVPVPSNARYMRLSVETRYKNKIKLYTQLMNTVENHDESIDKLSNVEIPLKTFVNEYVQNGVITAYDGWTRSDYTEFSGELLIVTNDNDDFGSTHNAFYDENKNFLSMFSIYPKSNENWRKHYEVVAPIGAKYFIASGRSAEFKNIHFYLGSKNLFYNSDILRLNDKATVGQRIIQSQMHYNPYDGSVISTKILTLSVFTDIHAFDTEFKRYIRFTNEYRDYVDDRICLGDVVRDNFPQDFTYWTDNPDADSILIVLGNHDASTYEDGRYVVQPTLSCYNKFFKNLIGNWNVVQPSGAVENGLCYYYKDYTDSNIRLIVLDCMHYTDTQNDWLVSTLESAMTAGLHVICAKHYNVSRDLTKVDGNFYNPDLGFGKLVIGDTNNNKAQSAVSNFQSAGGNFVCWLTGDAHYDAIGELTMNEHKQLCITFENAGCHAAWGDDARVVGQKSEDSFNIVSIDTYSKLLKIVRVGNDMNRFMQSKQYMCYDYYNNEVISVF